MAEITLQARSGAETNQMPKDFTVQYSSDGSNWTTIASFTGETAWGSSEVRAFQVQP